MTTNKARVYLAGKMAGLTWDEAIGWRLELSAIIQDHLEVLSPMRGKTKENWVVGGPYPEHLLYGTDVIITQDVNDVKRADAIAVRFKMGEETSIGTLLEVGRAMGEKPVVMIIDPRDAKLRSHPFLASFPMGAIVPTISSAADLLLSMFNVK